MKFLLSLTFPDAGRIRRGNARFVAANRAQRFAATVGPAGDVERL
ncbi:hypothetical protein [Nocardia jiangxiensis]|uniref:Uncharacterized protein n=1 Tax=Nocardia jiangxiensis TaxID=282685 RepID=A0ABW6SBQ4_9NOCA|nr:hypothetical protein [Nocardia jiangxiensis]